MEYIKQIQVSKFQQFIMNKLYAHNSNVHNLSLYERLTLSLKAIKEHKKAYELMSKNDSFYLNFLTVAKVVLLPTDKETIYELINIAFKVVLRDVCLNENDEELRKLVAVHTDITKIINDNKKEIQESKNNNNKKVTM